MASPYGYPDLKTLEPQSYLIGGIVTTDAGGVVLNAAGSSAPLDAFGNRLTFPKGCTVAKNGGNGLYRITLSEPWPLLVTCMATPVISAANAGTFQVTGYNPTGAVVGGQPVQTIDLTFQSGGAAVAFNSKSFFLFIWLKNLPANL